MRDLRRTVSALLVAASLGAQTDTVTPTATVHATVHPSQRARIRARTPARVARVFVAVGDTVRGLDKLIQLSAPELVADVGAAEAHVLVQEQRARWHAAEIRKLQQSQRSATERAKAAKALVDTATQQLAAQQERLHSTEQLVEAGRAEHRQVFEARQRLLVMQHDLRRSEMTEAETRELAGELKVAIEQAEIAAAEHNHKIAIARAARDRAAALLAAQQIKSTLEHAVVTSIPASAGSTVQAGDHLIELVDARTVKIELHIPAHLSHRVGKGCPVRLVEDGKELAAGTVMRYSKSVLDNGFAAAWLDLDNQAGEWIPGRVLQAQVELRK